MNREEIERVIRIISIARKPTDEEFVKIAKITGAGMIGIGLVGSAISFISGFL